MRRESIIQLLKTVVVAVVMLTSLDAWAAGRVFEFEQWRVEVDNLNGDVTVDYGEQRLLNKSNAVWGADNHRRAMSQATSYRVAMSPNSDIYGEGRLITLRANYAQQRVEQRIYLYSGKPYLHTELEVAAEEGVALNYMAPVSIREGYTLFADGATKDYHSLFIPFDNDAFIRYRSIPFGEPTESYGVTAFFDAESRRGMVVGAVEHTEWKSAVKATTKAGDISTLSIYGGASSSVTRDLIPHGKVVGQRVKSPRMTIGWWSDWREGMESFGKQCATFAPRLPSMGGRPFGWNSWGALATKVTFQKALEVSDFIHDYLQNRSFENDGVVYIDIDSFWDFGFRPHQHKIFVEHCRANGQKAGIYWCPFTDWGGNGKAKVVHDMDYTWEDVYIRAKGEPVKFDGGIAIDPTHPAVRRRIELQIKQFLDWGYEFVKLDFMAHGAYQSDSYFDGNITTAMQAYNQGMQYIVEQCEGRMWINLSIAPLFPGNYAHSRRISCDAWADINNTEYVLNSLTYGWWLDRIYHYNDGDHIVYRGVSEGENRARVTSSAITGVYFLGDDMSLQGDARAKDKVVRNTTNADINEIARTCQSFRPLEIARGDRGADIFYHFTEKYLYVAVFNFSGREVKRYIDLERLGLPADKEYHAKELWSQDATLVRGHIPAVIGGRDVAVYRINCSMIKN
ncbi:MAG: alpha-galactosidase [Alistipes sp.]|nr:alpha-galactosidase [Alistipes sp.]